MLLKSLLLFKLDFAIIWSMLSGLEFNIESKTDEDKIKKKIEEGKDIFDRHFNLKKINIDSSFPEYIVKNRKNLKNWIIS